ncbi:mRNA interferase HigB [Paraburkholderia fungorum]|jgi:mRNA interferase HigB|nr:mRNA interferase HigB [Paraburkholderia fungorum]
MIALVPIWDYNVFMKIIAKRVLTAFGDKHPNARQSLLAWHEEATKAAWMTPQDIKSRYSTASFVGRNRVIFNIKGNDYRLIVAVAYRVGIVYIKFVGTHGEYDRIDAETVELE